MIKKITFTFLILITLSFLIISCQDVFTYSALESLQRDPEDLSDDEKIGYGYSALASGDLEYIQKAYAVIKPLADKSSNAGDIELQELAYYLAVGSAGIQDEIINSLDAFLDPDGDVDEALTALEAAVANMDVDDIVDAIEVFERIYALYDLTSNLDAIDDGLYLNTALVTNVLLAKALGGFDNVDFSLLPDVSPADGSPDVPGTKPTVLGVSGLDLRDVNDFDNPLTVPAEMVNYLLLMNYAVWCADKGGVSDMNELFTD